MNRSDQFDIRLNIDDLNHLDDVLNKLKELYSTGKARYVHCSGIEKGENPNLDSFGVDHVHVALILWNFTSVRSIINQLVFGGNGYYIVCRNKALKLDGWLAYHSKMDTKLPGQPGLILQLGNWPKEKATAEEAAKKRKVEKGEKKTGWERRKELVRLQAWETLDEEFPGFIYSSSGQTMKREIIKQLNDEHCEPIDGDLKNYIIYGPSGSGKSSSVSVLYPNCYKKQKGTHYWDGYDRTDPNHRVVWIDEMSVETLKTLTGKAEGGFEFLKELADRYAVTVDEKYTRGYKIRPKCLIITMNEHPHSLLPDRAVEVNKAALHRKFKILHVDEWLVFNGMVNTPKGAMLWEDAKDEFPAIVAASYFSPYLNLPRPEYEDGRRSRNSKNNPRGGDLEEKSEHGEESDHYDEK
jgi:hypothetical protein